MLEHLPRRDRSFAAWLQLVVLIAGSAVAAGPAEQLAEFRPQLFPPGSLADAAVGGDYGARLVGTAPAVEELGFRQGDVILAADGAPLAVEGWAPVLPKEPDGRPPEAGRFVVWRRVPGERPVFSAAVLGRKVLDEFAALADSEWAPMRLAVMLANQQTIVVQGGGIVLVPAPAGFDAELWLRAANPLPPGSEAALAAVVQAVVERTSIPPATAAEELGVARAELARRRYPEALEHAQRAMVAAVARPEARTDRTTLAEATRTYLQIRHDEQARRSRLLAPEPLVGIVVEGQVNRIDAFLPQKTLLRVDPSTGYCFLGGVRVRAPVDDVPVVSELFLIAEYGVIKNTFVDSQGGAEILATTLQQISFELMYRPRVESVLRPFLRGGFGIFPFSATGCGSVKVIDQTEFGGLIGGGLDVYHIPALKLRASVAGSYRLLHSKFNPDYAPLLEGCTNAGVDLQDGFYDFDLDGWQVGLMLTFEL